MKAICAQCGTENTTEATRCTHCQGALPITTPAQPSNTDISSRMLISILGMLFAPLLLLVIGMFAARLLFDRSSPGQDAALLYAPLLSGVVFALWMPVRWYKRIIIVAVYAPIVSVVLLNPITRLIVYILSCVVVSKECYFP